MRLHYDETHYIELPNEWLGKHARQHDEAYQKARDAELPATWRDFAVSVALLDDWYLPGLPKNPEKWDFETISLRLMAWVKVKVLSEYYKCFDVSKNYSPPLSDHSTPAANQGDGTGDTTE